MARIEQQLGPHGEWMAILEFGDEPEAGPISLTVRPTNTENPPRGGLSSVIMRELNFTEAVAQMRTARAIVHEGAFFAWSDTWAEDVREEFRTNGISDLYLSMLSALYLSLVRDGERRVMEALTTRAGAKSQAAAKSHLWQATRRGLLVRSAGRAGGHLTDRAIALLAGKD